MPWQAPKTNWTSADGVRDTDLNRIEENTRVLYLERLRGSATVYVSPAGNDSTGTGSSGAPFLTVAKALSILPRDLNGLTANIHFLAAGAYPENVTIKDFYGGTVILTGPVDATVSLMGLRIENCNVQVSNIALSVYSTGIFVGMGATLVFPTKPVTVTAGGITVRYGGLFEASLRATVSNADRALQVQYGGTASIATLSGTNNSVGIFAYNSTVFVSDLQLTATARIVNENSAIYTRGIV